MSVLDINKITPKELERLMRCWNFRIYEADLTRRCDAYIAAERAQELIKNSFKLLPAPKV